MFTIFNQTYGSPQELMHRKLTEFESCWVVGQMPIWQDVYGRRVLHMRERFPCFDVYDRLYENRYFHWYLVECPEGLGLLYTADERPEIKVTHCTCAAELPQLHLTDWQMKELRLSGLKIPE